MTDFLFLGSNITADHDSSHEIKGHLLLGTKAMTNLDSFHFTLHTPTESESPGLGSENLHFKKLTVVMEKILESPLDCKEIQPVHPKGNQS